MKKFIRMLMNRNMCKNVEKVAIGTGGKVYPGWWCGDFEPQHPQEHFIDATKVLPFNNESVLFFTQRICWNILPTKKIDFF